ncbi:uncharacterized protein LOC126750322 [Anthonomus grandis grandis]|uniref:uncharacterized protein LOC126750322 n=1 Tax=Anthonomus grandis grandis TaxID=2921223 RepID=UPI002166B37B|nr:uncharacterized protein LOC126750322 [Anthonomus grandis grandis]
MNVFVVFIIYMFSVMSEDHPNVSPEDEEFSESGVLMDFLTALERQSGLVSLEPNYVVYGINCPDFNQCTVNPSGDLIWEVRSLFYSSYMMHGQEDEDAQKVTIDGCLKYNPTDSTAYNQCMQQVRRSMRIDMAVKFDSIFRSLLEANCSLSSENCYDGN